MKKNMLKSISTKLALTLVLILGISMVSKAEIVKMTIKEDLASCTGVAPMTCMQVKYKNSKNWELFYGDINGFKFEPGYRYTVMVNRTKRKNVPADASAYTYTLKKVVKKQKMQVSNTAWDFVLKHKWQLIQMNGVVQTESPVYMQFDAGNKRVGGKSGCNNFFGGFEKTGSKLSFKQMGSTLMACTEELNKLEYQFLNMLSNKTYSYDVADQTLNLYQNNKLVLMFGMAPLDK